MRCLFSLFVALSVVLVSNACGETDNQLISDEHGIVAVYRGEYSGLGHECDLEVYYAFNDKNGDGLAGLTLRRDPDAGGYGLKAFLTFPALGVHGWTSELVLKGNHLYVAILQGNGYIAMLRINLANLHDEKIRVISEGEAPITFMHPVGVDAQGRVQWTNDSKTPDGTWKYVWDAENRRLEIQPIVPSVSSNQAKEHIQSGQCPGIATDLPDASMHGVQQCP